MNRTFKAHPLFVFFFMKPFLFILLLPVANGVLQYAINRDLSGILPFELFFTFVIFLLSIAELKAFSVTAGSDRLYVNSGFIVEKRAFVDFCKISSAVFEKTPIDVLFGAVTCKINTEAGSLKKPDFTFKLKKSDAILLSDLIYGTRNGIKIVFSPSEIAIVSAGTSSAISGILFAVPFINRIGSLLGVAINDMLISRLNSASDSISTYFPPAVNIITVVFLASYAISFAVMLVSYAKLNMQTFENTVTVSSGLIVRRRTFIKTTAVNGVLTEQTPVMRFFGRYCIGVSSAGFGKKHSKSVLVPSMNRSECEQVFSAIFNDHLPCEAFIRPSRHKFILWRFYFMPRLYGILILLFSFAVILFFPMFTRLTLFVSTVLMAVNLYYAYLCRNDYKNGKISLGKTVCAESSRFFTVRRLNCKKERIGEIKLTRTPADRLYRTCKVGVVLRSQDAESVRVKNVGFNPICEKLLKEYGIKPQ